MEAFPAACLVILLGKEILVKGVGFFRPLATESTILGNAEGTL